MSFLVVCLLFAFKALFLYVMCLVPTKQGGLSAPVIVVIVIATIFLAAGLVALVVCLVLFIWHRRRGNGEPR